MDNLNRYTKFGEVLIIVALFLFVPGNSFAQKSDVISNVYAYFIEQLPGTIRVDKDGNPFPVNIDTITIIYVETGSKNISWIHAVKDGRRFTIAAQQLVQVPFNAGKLNNGNSISLCVQKNNFLWQLYLKPDPLQKINSFKLNDNRIIITGKYKGKTVSKKSGIPQQLETIPSV